MGRAKSTENKILSFPTATAPPPKKKETGERYKLRSDGRYQLEKRYTLPDGTNVKKSFYGQTQKEAAAKRRAFERDLADGKNAASADVYVKQYAESWLRIYKANVAVNTYKTYQHDVELLTSWCGGKKIKDITLSDVQEVLNTRAGLSKSAIKKTAMTLRAIFETARADRIIVYNPCDRLVSPDGGEGTHRAIVEVERELITTKCQDHRFHLAAMLMLYAGLRRGEVMAFHVDRDVDFSASTLKVSKAIHHEGNAAVLGSPKTDASIRTVPILFPPLMGLLKQHKGKGLVLSDAKGDYMSSSAFKRVWQSYLTSLEVELNGASKRWASEKQKQEWEKCTIRCHDLRHTFCTLLYEAEVDVKTAQLWMGHADVMVTMRIYTHLSNQKQEKAVKKAKKHFEKLVACDTGENVGQNVGQKHRISLKNLRITRKC